MTEGGGRPKARNGKPTEKAKAKKTEKVASSAGAEEKKAAPRRRSPVRARRMPGTGITTAPRDKPPKEMRLGLIERVRIGQELAIERAKKTPTPWDVLEQRYGIPSRTLRRTLTIFEEERETQGDSSGVTVLQETLDTLGQIIRHSSELAVQANNPSSQTGAMRVLMDALHERVQVMVAMGRIPRSFRAVDEAREIAKIIKRFSDLLDEEQVPPEVVQKFVVLLEDIHPIIDGNATPVASLPRAS